MPRTHSSTRRRLINAALDLFTSQGFNLTTTKQISDLADVNEATLFRNFGGKHDLLLAVIEDSGMFSYAQDSSNESVAQASTLSEAVKHYSRDRLHTLKDLSELLRALVGEAGHYSVENRRTLGTNLMQATEKVAQDLATVIEQQHVTLRMSPEKFTGLLNNLLFGYLMTDLTSEFRGLWDDRDDFLNRLVELCLYGAVSSPSIEGSHPTTLALAPDSSHVEPPPSKSPMDLRVMDLPTDLVHLILKQAKKQGAQTYAIAYLLFGAGLLTKEIVALERSHHICNPRQHLVQINQGAIRQVPVNQWIMGKRYGSYANNPLSQWLKNRKDEASALFITDQGRPLSESGVLSLWQEITAHVLTPENTLPRIEQVRQTWCVDMLMKGMSQDDLSILSGWTMRQLQPYVRRAREKAALERAIQLDQK